MYQDIERTTLHHLANALVVTRPNETNVVLRNAIRDALHICITCDQEEDELRKQRRYARLHPEGQ